MDIYNNEGLHIVDFTVNNVKNVEYIKETTKQYFNELMWCEDVLKHNTKVSFITFPQIGIPLNIAVVKTNLGCITLVNTTFVDGGKGKRSSKEVSFSFKQGKENALNKRCKKIMAEWYDLSGHRIQKVLRFSDKADGCFAVIVQQISDYVTL